MTERILHLKRSPAPSRREPRSPSPDTCSVKVFFVRSSLNKSNTWKLPYIAFSMVYRALSRGAGRHAVTVTESRADCFGFMSTRANSKLKWHGVWTFFHQSRVYSWQNNPTSRSVQWLLWRFWSYLMISASRWSLPVVVVSKVKSECLTSTRKPTGTRRP